jgi:DNA-binding CsgD family transcriptional regulator
MKGGAGVYHELALADRSTIEQSPAYQTLFAANGLKYTTGMTVPLPVGEAALCVGFDSSENLGYDRTAGRRLHLLLPAFEAGIEQVRRLFPVQSALGSLIDTLSEAIVLVGPDGSERHANRAFRALLAGEPDAEALREATRTLAADSLHPTASLVAARREVNLTGGLYRLRVGRLPPQLLGQRGTLVVVERCSPYPRPSALQERFQLTPREAEVALLLAEGRSNDDLAERLYISPHTVRHHVEKVLRKLDCASRAGVAHTLLQSNS